VEKEVASKHTKKFFELIMDKLPFGVAVNTISTGKALYANKSFKEIYNLDKLPNSPEEFFDLAYKDSELREEIKEKVLSDIESGDASKMVWEHVPMFLKGDEEKYITAVNIPLYNEDLMISTVKDVTSEVKAREALEESEMQLMHSQKMEAIGRLATNITHDFNNAIAVIKSACFLMLEKIKDEKVREDIKAIKNAAASAESLTRQLNIFGKKHKSKPEEINLSITLLEFEDLLKRLINGNVKLSIKCNKDIDKILVDKSELQQALMNLVLNAVDALKDGGQILIRAKNEEVRNNETIRGTSIPPGDYTVISVLDNGVGIPPEIIQHIFEPFYTTKEEKGTGLGLSIVYGFVKKADGYIYVNSIVGEGTIFEMYFPSVHN
jgi:signal transduction histidine kinase